MTKAEICYPIECTHFNISEELVLELEFYADKKEDPNELLDFVTTIFETPTIDTEQYRNQIRNILRFHRIITIIQSEKNSPGGIK